MDCSPVIIHTGMVRGDTVMKRNDELVKLFVVSKYVKMLLGKITWLTVYTVSSFASIAV
jgi:hypothetical protein